MYNNNSVIMELRLSGDPQRSDKVDAVKCNAGMFQGKRDQDKDPIWVEIVAWKFLATCLEPLRKGDTVIVSGSLEQQNWEHQGEKKSKLCLNCDSIAKKCWPAQQGQGQTQQPQTNYNQAPQNGGYGSQPQQPNYNQNQGGGYNGGRPGGYNQGRNEGGNPNATGGYQTAPDDD